MRGNFGLLNGASRLGTIALVALLHSGAAAAAASGSGGGGSAEIVQKMIRAHGGREMWSQAPTVSFTDSIIPAGAAVGLSSRATVEQTRRRGYIDYPATGMQLAWDGNRAWGVNWELPCPPRYLALLDYYLLNLPWIAGDPGVVLEPPGTTKLWDDPVEYVSVRMTFAPEVGKGPSDYYVLYIHPDNYLLKACRYAVSFRSEQAESSPELVLVYDRYQTVGGLVVPIHYTIYELDRAPYAACAVRGWSFERPFEEERMRVPEGAVIETSVP